MQTEIQKKLFEMGGKKPPAGMLPTIEYDTIIGIPTPPLRKFAKELSARGDAKEFLKKLPHKYFEENQLHAFIISEIKDFSEGIKEVQSFLPYIDNWGTCDQLSPKCFKKEPERLLPYIAKWLKSNHTYTIRFAIGRLMAHFLDERFDLKYPGAVAKIRSEEYYVNMMIAWYFATALAKQYEDTIPFLELKKLDRWTHNKTIQKAVESRRISDERKKYLKTLRIK